VDRARASLPLARAVSAHLIHGHAAARAASVREIEASRSDDRPKRSRATLRERGASTPRDRVQLRLVAGMVMNQVGPVLRGPTPRAVTPSYRRHIQKSKEIETTASPSRAHCGSYAR